MTASEDHVQNSMDMATKNKVISLFRFVSELNKLKQKAVLHVREYPWYKAISDFPNDPDNISVYYPDRTEEEIAVDNQENILLSVHKPEYARCPEPDPIFVKWLMPGWESFHANASVREQALAENG